MKICYALLVFNKYDQIIKLVEKLNFNCNEVIIYVDKKSEKLYLELKNLYKNNPQIHLIDNRIEIGWGHISMVEALKEIIKMSQQLEFDYITTMSESCLPLYNDEEIKKFLEENKGKEYIDVRFDWTKRSRLHLIHKAPYSRKMQKYRNILAIKDVIVDTLFGWAIKTNKQFKSWKVPTTLIWMTVTKNCVNYILNEIEDKKIIEKYRYTFCPDEHAVAEIIYKSPYYEKLNIKNLRGNNLVYCNWYTLKAPSTFTIKDYKKIYNHKFPVFYARKFDMRVDKEIIDKIYQNRENPNFKYKK